MEEISPCHYKSYINLMFKFSNFNKEISQEDFNKSIMNKDIKIIVYIDNNNVIGAGTIFKLNKIHNNPVGQIEDVMIDENYRNKGIGKKIIDKLTHIALNDFKCYKVILNCLNNNIEFYEKCNFYNSGVQMRYNV
jgi:glucosamine-phosphate N-acetyltransferase